MITLPVRFLNFKLKTPSASLSVSGFLPIVFSSVSSEALSSSVLVSAAVSVVVSAAITVCPASILVPIAAVIKTVTIFFFILLSCLSF